MFAPAPYLLKDVSVSQVMIQVCIALVPAIAAYVWLIGPAILVQLVIASIAARTTSTGCDFVTTTSFTDSGSRPTFFAATAILSSVARYFSRMDSTNSLMDLFYRL